MRTPGPWTVGGSYNMTVISLEGDTIATCNVSRFDGNTCEANARLIAAAPELLNAVQSAADLCEGLLPGLSGLKAQVVDGMRKDFLALIQKAEGA